MSDVIFRHEGTIDKYMGDAIMAFWGAPKAQPDHARRACLAALEMCQELERLNAELKAEGLPRLEMGVGINTGFMAVGNMGSERRFDYTVMGDAVNLASRLEGLNKEYGTSIVVSESTLAQAGPDLRSRFVDLVAVKGKKEPTAVHELIPANGTVDAEHEAALAAYQRGIERYRAGDFAGALPHFEQALGQNGHDGPVLLYLERCREMLDSPPPADWDGVYVMTRK
jgi:adenylate cyclase